MQEDEINNVEETGSTWTLNNIFWLCASHWYWFVISLIVCVGLGVLYLLVTPPVYEREAALLIKDDKAGNTAADVGKAFSDMGFLQTSSNVSDELVSFQSPMVMLEVVNRLGLQVSYITRERLKKVSLYGPNLPVLIEFADMDAKGRARMEVTLDEKGGVTLDNFIDKHGDEIDAPAVKGHWNASDTLATPFGRVVVTKNPVWKPSPEKPIEWPLEMKVRYKAPMEVAQSYLKRLSVEAPDDYDSAIFLKIADQSSVRAEDILATIIDVYNENWINDKNRMSVSAAQFIRERLSVIEQELGEVDNDISSYKSANKVPDLAQASSIYFTQAADADKEAEMLATQLKTVKYIGSLLSDPAHANEVLPANTALSNLNLENQIATYNTQLLQRNSLAANSSNSNPLVLDLDTQLAGLRSSILKSIDNYIASLTANVKQARDTRNQAAYQLQNNPTQARYLLSVERQQKVKESLYLYLLQRREENELSKAFTAYNTRVITPPVGSDIPVSPMKAMVLMLSAALGLMIPCVALYFKELLDTTVRGRSDVQNLSMPFLAEIPLGYKRRSGLALLRKARDNEKDRRVIMVEHGNNNAVNEAFRVMRTNLELMTDADRSDASIVMITSANVGSGKTFITMNFAVTLAIKGKRVAVVDLDLRKAAISSFVGSPSVGISALLSGHATLDQIIVKNVNNTNGLDLVPVGVIPPNPAELLYSQRLKALFDELRKNYDYVLVDCPPVEVVADATIINSHVDSTIFVVRVGVLERSMLPVIERYYTTSRYRHMSLVLNGTESHSAHSPYGYGYGYGYGYDDNKKQE